jgi:hypothetical protein
MLHRFFWIVPTLPDQQADFLSSCREQSSTSHQQCLQSYRNLRAKRSIAYVLWLLWLATMRRNYTTSFTVTIQTTISQSQSELIHNPQLTQPTRLEKLRGLNTLPDATYNRECARSHPPVNMQRRVQCNKRVHEAYMTRTSTESTYTMTTLLPPTTSVRIQTSPTYYPPLRKLIDEWKTNLTSQLLTSISSNTNILNPPIQEEEEIHSTANQQQYTNSSNRHQRHPCNEH